MREGVRRVWHLTANTTVPATPPTNRGQMLRLIFIQDATGSRTVTWDATFSDAPQPSQAPNAVSVLRFVSIDGTTWRYAGPMMASPWTFSGLQSHAALVGTAAAATVYVGGYPTATGAVAAGVGWVTHYIDPADYAVGGKTVQWRVVASFNQNTVANAATAVTTAGLYPVVMGGATTNYTPTVGTLIAGSTAARTGGAASSEQRVVSAPFTIATADTYALGFVLSVAASTGVQRVAMRLEYRLV